MFPKVLIECSPYLLAMAIVGVIYASLAAWAETDFKRLLAYSSLAHINFILAGLFVWSHAPHTGAIFQSFNHGITIAALFLLADWLSDKIQTQSLGNVSGLVKYLPHLCWVTLFFILSSVGLPGLNNFVGELMILLGVFGHYPWAAALLGTSIILSVAYMLRWFQSIFFGSPSPLNRTLHDIGWKKVAILLPLILLVLWLGLFPSNIVNPIQSHMIVASNEESL